MRLTRFIDPDQHTRLGLDLGDGTAAPLALDAGTDAATLYALHRAGTLTPAGDPVPITRRLAPVRPAAIFGIGLNYREHAHETGGTIPERPVVFMKNPAAVNDPDAPIRLPRVSPHPEVDYECELAVVIGAAARDVPEDRALDVVLGYTAANDVSARWWQKKGCQGQFVRGKSFDTFCPLGPVLVTPDELPDPQALRLGTTLNGESMQSHTTGDMVFSVAQLIAFLSQDTTLLPGTVILTGTPQGVGAARDPQVFLNDGDEVVVEVEGIGKLRSPVVGQG